MEVQPPAWGEAVPWFSAEVPNGNRYELSNMAGRFVVLVFLDHSPDEEAVSFVDQMKQSVPLNDPKKVVIFGVCGRKEDFGNSALLNAFPPGRLFYDKNHKIAESFGIGLHERTKPHSGHPPRWFVLDPTLRIFHAGPLSDFTEFARFVGNLQDPAEHCGIEDQQWAPVLLLPRVLSPTDCSALINYYRTHTSRHSGFMKTEGSHTVEKLNTKVKSRSDVCIEDEKMISLIRNAVNRKIVPEIRKVFQFQVTRIERFIVARYAAEEAGHFLAHRDNTTAGTAHRNFAVTINLNPEDYEGGGLQFPEYGNRIYQAPRGGAVVFSCSLLHEALPVTKGERFATLPFLYGEEEATIREKNQRYLKESS